MKFLSGRQVEPQIVNLRHWALATLCPIIVMVLAMAFKPLWRDEYWSLFFADPSFSFSELLSGRLRDEVHPPFYYFLLHGWQAHLRQLAIFLLICAGSYWVIYFSTEIRPYILLFSLASISVFIVPKLISDEPLSITTCLMWSLIGGALGVTHYFGALWFACIGFTCGVSVLARGYKARFFIIGLFTLIGLIPVMYWLLISFSQMDLSGEEMVRPLFAELGFVINQLLRGLLVKTFGSNPLVTYLGFGGLWFAFRLKNRVSAALLWAVLLTIIIAFVIHFSFVALIKERAFSVIMPALLFIFAYHISDRKSVSMRFIPLVTLLMPLLFWGEYFKNREKIPELRETLSTYSEICKGQTVLAYYTSSSMHEDFNPMASRRIIDFTKDGVAFDVKLLDAKTTNEITKTSCPVKAVGFLMSRRHSESLIDARTVLQDAGVSLDAVEEIKFGKGRNIIWVEK